MPPAQSGAGDYPQINKKGRTACATSNGLRFTTTEYQRSAPGQERETRVDAVAFEQLQHGKTPSLKQTAHEQAAAEIDWRRRRDVFLTEIRKFPFGENALRILATSADYSYGLCRLSAPFPNLLDLAQLAGVRAGDIRGYLNDLEAAGVIHVRELLDEDTARIGYAITPVFQSSLWRLSEDKLRPAGSEQNRMALFDAADRRVRTFVYDLESKARLGRWLISPLEDADLVKAQNELPLDGPTPKKSEPDQTRGDSTAPATPIKPESAYSPPAPGPAPTPKISESSASLNVSMSECVNERRQCFSASERSSLNAAAATSQPRASRENDLMARIKAIINRDPFPDDGRMGKTWAERWGADWRKNYIRKCPQAVEDALLDAETRIRENPNWHPDKYWHVYLKDLVQRLAGLKPWNQKGKRAPSSDPPAGCAPPKLSEALEHFKDRGESEVYHCWLTFEATKSPENRWFWGKGIVTDWRIAMAARLADDRRAGKNPVLHSPTAIRTAVKAEANDQERGALVPGTPGYKQWKTETFGENAEP
jgi:hypothetical protein